MTSLPYSWLAVAFIMLPTVPSAAICRQDILPPAQSPLAGARVFGSKGCVRCHPIHGVGGQEAPDLGRHQQLESVYAVAASLWNHLPTMVTRMRELGIERPRLSPRESGNLVAFLFSVHALAGNGDENAGSRLFREKSCVRCHQIEGAGGVVGPNLDFLALFRSTIHVSTALWNHGPSMSAAMRAQGIRRPTFTESELTDLLAYLRSATIGAPEVELYLLPGSADRGRDTFSTAGCINCHRVGGEGGSVGPDLSRSRASRSVTELAALMWNKAPAMEAAMRARGMTVPRLRPDEMADLIAYLHSVQYFRESGNPGRGRRHIQNKGCLECHSLEGRGAGRAVDLAQVRDLSSAVDVIAALWNHAVITVADPSDPVPWPTLRDGEMADVVAYLESLSTNQ